jgi:hypothetical protein
VRLNPKDQNGKAMWKGCQKKELQEIINGSHLPLDQYEDQRIDGKMM